MAKGDAKAKKVVVKKTTGVIRSLTANNDSVKEARALSFNDLLGIEQSNLIQGLKSKIAQLNSRKLELTDFNADSTTDLNKHLKGFNHAEWVAEYHEVVLEMFNLKAELKLAEETFTDFFLETEFESDEDESGD